MAPIPRLAHTADVTNLRRRGPAAAVLAAILAIPAAGGSAQTPAAPALTVYSSLPLAGTALEQSQAVVDGARLALDQAGGQAGPFPVRYVSLNDATRGYGAGVARLEARNARRAAADSSAIAYIGAFNSSASKISMPILNRVPLLQISPSNTFNGLTTGEPGTDPGEPGKYYPTGRRHYVRIQPRDTVQSAALVVAMRRARCRRALLLHDGTVYGAGIAFSAKRAARRRGLKVTGPRRIALRARSYRRLARLMRRRNARCAMYGGVTDSGAVRLFTDLARVRGSKLFASDGVGESLFTRGLPRRARRKVRISISTIPVSALPAAGRTFAAAYRARYGKRLVDPYAAYGYESMALALDAIRRGGGARQATVDAAFATRNRASVLGTYSIGLSGDTTLTDYGIYRITRGGAFRFGAVVRP